MKFIEVKYKEEFPGGLIWTKKLHEKFGENCPKPKMAQNGRKLQGV